MDQEPIDATYITAMVKGGSNGFALKGADATAGPLKSLYDGARPAHYQPMKKQGSIILGIGGDNSDSAQGTFYEGVMTSGYASNATDAAVQANIVAAGCECSRSHFFALPLSLLLTYLLLRRWEVSAPPINPGFAHTGSAPSFSNCNNSGAPHCAAAAAAAAAAGTSGGGKGPAMATSASSPRSTAQRSGPSSRATGSPSSLVMPGRAMTPFRSPLTHTVRVAASRSSSRPWSTQ